MACNSQGIKRKNRSYYRKIKKDTDDSLLLFSINDSHNKSLTPVSLLSSDSESDDNISHISNIDLKSDSGDFSHIYSSNDDSICAEKCDLDDFFKLNETNPSCSSLPLFTECTNIDNGHKTDIKTQLAQWALSENITHSALGNLLKILKPHFEQLPLDPRTLLKTPRRTETKIISPGEYHHFGLEKVVNYLLQQKQQNTKCEICVNIDGVPLSKSSGSQFYPILVSLFPVENLVGLVGIYHGYKKPVDANLFLRDFIDEAIKLTNNGLTFRDKIIPFEIKAFICDAPAKAFIKNIKSHTGYFSCTKCCQEGEFIDRKMCFPDIDFIERSNYSFTNKIQEEHHVGDCSLQEIPNLNMISAFPLDYMHLLCLGVMKKLILTLWISGRPPFKLSSNQINKISDLLLAQSGNIPIEFCRKPRSLSEVKRWKATEFRQFLLYTGPIVLKSVLDQNKYLNFLSLHVATRILCSNLITSDHLKYAHSLLIYFVELFSVLYGKENISHNIHNLLHISQDATNFGKLDNFSAFPFENYMQILKKHVRKSDKPIAQVINRIAEREQIFEKNITAEVANIPSKEHHSGPLLQNCCEPQYQEYKFNNFKLKIKHPDNCCMLKNGSVIVIENFATDFLGNVVIIGRKFENLKDIFTSPCKSSDIGIYQVYDLGRMHSWPVSDVELKYVPLVQENTVVFPLLHSE